MTDRAVDDLVAHPDDQAADHRNCDCSCELEDVAAVLGPREVHRTVPKPSPVDGHDRKDSAGLNRDVEKIRAPAEPVLCYQQMSRARDRQELSDALDDAEQDNLQQTFHSPPVIQTWEQPASYPVIR